jgi:SHS2 domain-containing protein
MRTWKLLEHTADLAIEARGANEAEAVEALCLALLAQITDAGRVGALESLRIVVDGLDRSETLVSVLGEILFRVNVEGWLFAEFRVHEASAHRIAVEAVGERRDPARHPFDLEVKAATYHELYSAPRKDGAGWVIRMIFDV